MCKAISVQVSLPRPGPMELSCVTWEPHAQLQLQGRLGERHWKEFDFLSPVKSGSNRQDLVSDLCHPPSAGQLVALGCCWFSFLCPICGSTAPRVALGPQMCCMSWSCCLGEDGGSSTYGMVWAGGTLPIWFQPCGLPQSRLIRAHPWPLAPPGMGTHSSGQQCQHITTL